ncbi:head decoration protein [Aureimonas sp. SK2]|uniref:head decoration protein n=1 Tax=Aureimonas sp. SK2 TaxID=3015992 RepID=UPI0024438E20|nr:head decoration protein [Aureimonas sp. SK2]
MADWLTPYNPDEAFLLAEANGFRSRGKVVLKAGADYQAGTVLEAEEVAGDPTGFAIPYVGAETAFVLCRHVDATDAAPLTGVEAAVIESDAEVKRHELTLPTVPAAAASAVAALAAVGIKVR